MLTFFQVLAFLVKGHQKVAKTLPEAVERALGVYRTTVTATQLKQKIYLRNDLNFFIEPRIFKGLP